MLYPGTLNAPHVIKFCSRVVPEHSPVSVVYQPEFGQPQNECFPIVEHRVSEFGGEQVIGWAIWERPGVFIEAEFHSVWRNPTGQLIDVSPRPYNFKETTFLPDPSRKYTGRQVDNVRCPLVKDQDVTRFLYLASRRYQIMNTGSLAEQHGEITLPKKLYREYMQVMKEAAALELKIARKYPAGFSEEVL